MKTLPICQNCGAEWSWFETFKIGFKGSKRCKTCGERQYVTPKFSIKNYAFYIIPLFILILLNTVFDFSLPVFIALVIPFMLVLLISVPYTIQLSNEQKPLW